jgi:hypothetical protein
VAIQPGDGNGYVRTNPWSQPARDEFAQRIESVFVPRNHETALTALFNRWYHDGRYAFSIDEVIDVLKVDQVIRKAPRAALVLPGGGVRATYQSVILDYLYGKRIVNAGWLHRGSNSNDCYMADVMPPIEDQRLVINGIAGTSGGALLGYFASRRDTSPSKVLTKLWIDDEFRAQCAGSEFRSCQVQIVLLLESMIRELVAARHSNAVRQSVRSNHVDARNFGFLTSILSVTGNFERLTMSSQHCTRTFVKPFRGGPDLSECGAPSILSPIEHFHTVRHIVVVHGMHRLPIARTAEMGKARSGNHAPRTLVRMVNRRQQAPF